MAFQPAERIGPLLWSTTAVTFGYAAGLWNLSPALLLALPIGELLSAWWTREQATDASEPGVARLARETAAVRAAVEDAERRAARAAAGLVSAADLAARMEEESRATIVADLHDSVAQTLVALAYLRYDPDASQEDFAELAATAERELRDVMVAQRPVVGKMTSLAATMGALVADVGMRHRLQVDVQWEPPDVRYPFPVAVGIYRFAAEALVNVAKHSGTDRARMTVTGDETRVAVQIKDEGCGFDTAGLAGSRRLGLALLGHRAEMLGATVTVDSAPGVGTTATMEIPLTGLVATHAPPLPPSTRAVDNDAH